MKKLLAKMRSEEGQALVEYGLLVALIAVVCIGVIALVGSAASTTFSKIAASL